MAGKSRVRTAPGTSRSPGRQAGSRRATTADTRYPCRSTRRAFGVGLCLALGHRDAGRSTRLPGSAASRPATGSARSMTAGVIGASGKSLSTRRRKPASTVALIVAGEYKPLRRVDGDTNQSGHAHHVVGIQPGRGTRLRERGRLGVMVQDDVTHDAVVDHRRPRVQLVVREEERRRVAFEEHGISIALVHPFEECDAGRKVLVAPRAYRCLLRHGARRTSRRRAPCRPRARRWHRTAAATPR